MRTPRGAEPARPGVPPAPRRRLRVHVAGTVQGVGFRPYLYRLVSELELSGFVRNEAGGVLLEVEGAPDAVERLVARLPDEVPPLARIEGLRLDELVPSGERGFVIAASGTRACPSTGDVAEAVSPTPASPLEVTADAATCDDCLAELFDPRDRRYRYPFINCTSCGPRYTIVCDLPYDRPLTTMAGFTMCPACQAEYDDPGDRRFHAQPNACPACGPTVTLLRPDGLELFAGPEAVDAAAQALRQGQIVALKGLGGFHLACRADDDEAVRTLRRRKRRPDQPFAVMVHDVDAADALVDLSEGAEAILAHRARPIVLAPRRGLRELRDRIAPSVAPGAPDLGVMLAYTPLHHLLVVDVGVPLVCTSGNRSGEPIVYRDDAAVARLGDIADLILGSDRPIRARADDSVVRAAALPLAAALPIRRSRGYVPASLRLPRAARTPILACGAERKATFCLSRGDRAWLGPHMGDLTQLETLEAFAEAVAQCEALLGIDPVVVAHDRHPDYLSTRYAADRRSRGHIAVQHHHAHLAAVLAEHGEAGPAVAAIYDGAGYGDDGSVWGGELLLGDLDDFERVGHLWPTRLPGGDRAAREPWRMACAWACEVDGADVPEPPPPLRSIGVEPAAWEAVARLARSGLQAPRTTSAGRLFDAVAAWCGVGRATSYEGQAAVALEALAVAAAGVRGAYPMPLAELGGSLVLDARETVAAVLYDVARGVDIREVARAFHLAFADATASALLRVARERSVGVVALSGGVFQNRLLLERTVGSLVGQGVRVLLPRRVPPNDGGIAFGQVAVASSRMARAEPA